MPVRLTDAGRLGEQHAHALRELAAAARRYNEFVRELARFNADALQPATLQR
jgi:hypothetical protein